MSHQKWVLQVKIDRHIYAVRSVIHSTITKSMFSEFTRELDLIRQCRTAAGQCHTDKPQLQQQQKQQNGPASQAIRYNCHSKKTLTCSSCSLCVTIRLSRAVVTLASISVTSICTEKRENDKHTKKQQTTQKHSNSKQTA